MRKECLREFILSNAFSIVVADSKVVPAMFAARKICCNSLQGSLL